MRKRLRRHGKIVAIADKEEQNRNLIADKTGTVTLNKTPLVPLAKVSRQKSSNISCRSLQNADSVVAQK